jgi:para-nitrobenzyl esterase
MLWLLLVACSPEKPSDPADTADTDVVDTDVVDTIDTDVVVPDTDLPPPSCTSDAGPAVQTSTGCVIGAQTGDLETFLGVPYAEPPVGDLRWRRPVPVTPWSTPLDATRPGPACPQTNGTLDGALEPGDGDEDCLTLNMLRPPGASNLPILFFSHGGSHVDGSGSQALYIDDPALAQSAIVVTHNYRLGPLGFLSHPLLSAEDPDGVSGNQGLRDTLMALQWVHDNASALGGDPDKVLIFGESAGGLTTCALWMMPEARGLFSAMLTESAPCTNLERPMRRSTLVQESGEDQGSRYAAELGCDRDPDPLACMRDADVSDVLAALPGQQGLLDAGETYGVVIDGVQLPHGYADALRLGDVAPVPVFATTNADEGLIFTAGIPLANEAAYRNALRPYALLARSSVDELAALYDPADYPSYAAAFSDLFGDYAFVCPTRQMLADVDGYGLYFGRDYLGAEVAGAFHGAELGYVFGTLRAAPAVDAALAETLQAAWTSTVTTPVVDGPWPQIGEGWVEVGADGAISTVADLKAEKCAVLGR